MINTETTELFT